MECFMKSGGKGGQDTALMKACRGLVGAGSCQASRTSCLQVLLQAAAPARALRTSSFLRPLLSRGSLHVVVLLSATCSFSEWLQCALQHVSPPWEISLWAAPRSAWCALDTR